MHSDLHPSQTSDAVRSADKHCAEMGDVKVDVVRSAMKISNDPKGNAFEVMLHLEPMKGKDLIELSL